MGARLGVDFGTCHTVAVLGWPDGRVKPLLFDGSPMMPSAVYAEPEGRLIVGRDALHSARLDPSRLEPFPKRCIGEGTVLLGDQELAVSDVVGAVLSRVAQEATRIVGERPAQITLTCPATWGDHRRRILAAAAGQAGLGEVRMAEEPVAAATYFAKVLGHQIPVGGVVVVYDFGGGTFDVSLLERLVYGFRTLALDGRGDIGGLDLDEALIERIGQVYGAADPVAWQRLGAPTTSQERRQRRLFRDDVRAVKERLSRHSSAELHIPVLDRDIHVTREEFETLARPLLEETIRLTDQLVRQSGVPWDRVAGVFLVGGSSRLPMINTLMQHRLQIVPTAIDQPELVVAEGSLLVDAGYVRPAVASAAPVRPPAQSAGVGQPAAGRAQPVGFGYPGGRPSGDGYPGGRPSDGVHSGGGYGGGAPVARPTTPVGFLAAPVAPPGPAPSPAGPLAPAPSGYSTPPSAAPVRLTTRAEVPPVDDVVAAPVAPVEPPTVDNGSAPVIAPVEPPTVETVSQAPPAPEPESEVSAAGLASTSAVSAPPVPPTPHRPSPATAPPVGPPPVTAPSVGPPPVTAPPVEPVAEPARLGAAVLDQPERGHVRVEPAPDQFSDQAPASERARRRWWVVAAAVAVLLVLAVTGALRYNQKRDTTGQGDGIASPGVSAVASTPTVAKACGLTQPVREAAYTGSGQPGPATFTPPEKWKSHLDPTGFRLVVPADWQQVPASSGVCFREPHGAGYLSVDQWRQADHDLVGYWTGREAEVSAGLVEYRKIGIAPYPNFYEAAAEWEFVYGVGPDALHARMLAMVTSGEHAYALLWCTWESKWQDNEQNFSIAIGGFRPAQ